MNQISLWEFMFSGQMITSVFISVLLFLGIIILYFSFLKYFSLKAIYTQNGDFLENIADCIFDKRIEAAKDWCERIISPESRMVKKGLDNIQKSFFEIFILVTNQRQIEVLEIRKSLSNLEIITKILVLIGFLGSGISFFIEIDENFLDEKFYLSLLPLVISVLLGLIFYVFQMVLTTIVHEIGIDLKLKENKFLEIISESK